MIPKYGWEIGDEVQRYVGNTAEMQFIEKSAYDALQAKLKLAVDALEKISSSNHGVDCDYHADEIAFEAIKLIKGDGE